MSQLGFDWDRAQRDRWIDEADLLPDSMSARGSTVRRTHMFNLLRVLNGFVSAASPECYASQKFLAIKMGLRRPTDPEESDRGVKTVQRTIDALSDLSLIIISRRVPAGGTKPVNHYRIVWSELLMLCSKRRAAILPREGERQQDYLSEQQDFSAEQEDYSCDQQDFFYEQQDLKSPNLITSRSINPSPTSNLDVPKKEEEELNNSLARLGSTDSILDRLVEEYSRESVYGAAELLGRAMHRVGAEYLERLLAYYRDRSGAWGPGALRNRVKHSQPGLAIDAGWPSPRPATSPVESPPAVARPKAFSGDPDFLQRKAAARQAAINGPGLAEELRARMASRHV